MCRLLTFWRRKSEWSKTSFCIPSVSDWNQERLVSECYANPLEDKPLKLVAYWGGRVVKHGHPSMTFGNNIAKGLSSHQGINGRLGEWRQGWHLRPSLNRDMSCNLPYIKNQLHYLSQIHFSEWIHWLLSSVAQILFSANKEHKERQKNASPNLALVPDCGDSCIEVYGR